MGQDRDLQRVNEAVLQVRRIMEELINDLHVNYRTRYWHDGYAEGFINGRSSKQREAPEDN